MQLLTLTTLLATASAALATVPTVSSFATAGCSGTPLATWSGVPENAFCQATPGAVALNITPGASDKNCQIDLYTTSNCDGSSGGFITAVPDTAGCFTASEEFASVRILCITVG
ncbi:hypothetical protein C8R46DRAFT_1093061 [Mycena filopes]|nr:hypothetical protein C8R46DRAFT_1093061 [Mycena filopes]